MSKKNGLEIENLDKWIEWLNSLENHLVDGFKDRVLRSYGLQTLSYVDDLTPRRSGRLQNSASLDDKDNIFTLKVGKTSYVVVGTAVEYAAHVEYGFQQQAGRFVPGYWKASGTFEYDPQAKTGMVLTGKVIAGAYMFTKAVDYAEEDLSEIVEFEFRRLYAELFK